MLCIVARCLVKLWIKEKLCFRGSIFHNVYIFSSHINSFQILLKFSHNIESFLSSSIFLSHKSVMFNLLDLACFQDCFRTRKLPDDANTRLTTDFFYQPKRKKIPMLWTTETTVFIRMIPKVFTQRKRPYLWIIANNDRNMLWGHTTDNHFLILSCNIHTYHLYSTTSTTSSWVENENFNVTEPWTQCWQLLFES